MNGDEMALEGASAPPMANGEVVFEAPWQSRVFGLARVLCEAGHYSWDDFRDRLIANIARWEEAQLDQNQPDQNQPEQAYEYFDCFLAALTDVLDKTGLCDEDLLAAREAEFAARPHGHDH